MPAENRTEEPTPRRLRQAREKGQVARSRDLDAAVSLLIATAALILTAGGLFAAMKDALLLSLEVIAGRLYASEGELLRAQAGLVLGAVAPLFAAVMVAGALTGFLQVGGLFVLEPLAPKIERLNPLEGARKLFSRRNVVEFVKACVKIAVVGAVLVTALVDSMPQMVRTVRATTVSAAVVGGDLIASILLRSAVAFGALAVLDLVYQRWQHRQDLRMTREEVKREYRESEGDPEIKRLRERTHREVFTHNMIEDVRLADCVIVNPDHIAVALRYDADENEAPEVVAKGERIIAQKIIEVARAHGVPIVRDVHLARALNELEIGVEIPEALFEAVAEILRFIHAEGAGEPEGSPSR